jgi:hypothetical protein
MSRFNVSSTHPLIPNSQEYMLYKKYVSIHSEDRDILRYPSSGEFEIELPQDYCNVQTVKLSTWTFPSNYSTFSQLQDNLTMTFRITNPYNPGDYGLADPLQDAIFEILYETRLTDFFILIDEGFYTPDQMATELNNRFNDAVSNRITDYLTTVPKYIALNLNDQFKDIGYTQFVIIYNSVAQKLYFGNRSSEFLITNDSELFYKVSVLRADCLKKSVYPEFTNWGLPAYLGFTRCPAPSSTPTDGKYPRLFFGEVNQGDNGFWLTPDPSLPGSKISYLFAPLKVNLMGPAYFYLEIDGMNCMDETMPYAISTFTTHTNETNGIVNSAFAKIAIPTTPISQYFDNGIDSYMLYNPPAERIRKIKIRLRYHNGAPVYFGGFDYSFTLEFTLLVPQTQRKYNLFVPEK